MWKRHQHLQRRRSGAVGATSPAGGLNQELDRPTILPCWPNICSGPGSCLAVCRAVLLFPCPSPPRPLARESSQLRSHQQHGDEHQAAGYRGATHNGFIHRGGACALLELFQLGNKKPFFLPLFSDGHHAHQSDTGSGTWRLRHPCTVPVAMGKKKPHNWLKTQKMALALEGH